MPRASRHAPSAASRALWLGVLALAPAAARAEAPAEASSPLAPAEAPAAEAARRAAVEDAAPPAPAARRGAWRPRGDDGPRRVPARRGASLARSRALGVGSTAALRALLAGALPDAVRRAAPAGMRTPLHWPVDGGRFGRGFGYVRETLPDLRHDGIDVVAPRGSVVRAVERGIVVYSDNGVRGFGNCVAIAHANGMVSIYAHQERTTVQPGWRVRRGERIGFVGDTGVARGPHLHLELYRDGRVLDPMRFLEAPDRDALEAVTLGPDGRIAAVGGRTLGDPATTLALLREGLDAPLRAAAGGRTFRDWLVPLRGGRPGRPWGDGHRGVDFLGEPGAAVRAAADGLVVHVGPGLPGLGDAVVLAHPTGELTLYGGLSEIAVQPGDRVLRGHWIGGLAGGPDAHLHFAVYRDGAPVDPDLRR